MSEDTLVMTNSQERFFSPPTLSLKIEKGKFHKLSLLSGAGVGGVIYHSFLQRGYSSSGSSSLRDQLLNSYLGCALELCSALIASAAFKGKAQILWSLGETLRKKKQLWWVLTTQHP